MAQAEQSRLQKKEKKGWGGMSIMVRFIFWCLKRLAILTIKYTKHPEGVFEMGDNVVVKGKRYHYKFEGNVLQKVGVE